MRIPLLFIQFISPWLASIGNSAYAVGFFHTNGPVIRHCLLVLALICGVCNVARAQLNVALAQFAIQKNVVDQDDLTLELATPRILKSIRILSSNAVLSSGASVSDLSKIQWNEGEPDVFLLSGVIGKDSSGALAARGLLASKTNPQIAVIKASGNDLASLVDDLFAKIDQAFSQSATPVLSGKWENSKTKSQYLITHWESNLIVRLLDAPLRPGSGEWSFARGTIGSAKGVLSANFKFMHHDYKFSSDKTPSTVAEKIGTIEATGRRIVFEGEEWRRVTMRHPKLLDMDLEKSPEFIAEVSRGFERISQVKDPDFQRDALLLGRQFAFLESHLGFVWSGFDVDQVQNRIGELQFQLEDKTLGRIPGAELHAGIPLIGGWTRAEGANQELFRLSVRIAADPDQLFFEIERLGAEWPDQRNLIRAYTEKRELRKNPTTGKYLVFSPLDEQQNRLVDWGVRPVGATDQFRTLPADPKSLESLKQLTGEQILATAQGAAPGRLGFQDAKLVFKVSKVNLDQPQIGQQTIYVDYRNLYQRTVSVDGQMVEVKLPHSAAGTLIRTETVLGKSLNPGELKNDPWKKSILSR